MNSTGPRGQVVPGSARGARVGGLVIWGVFSAALLPTFFLWGLEWGNGLVEGLLLLVLARTWFMGVVVSPARVVVKGWFWTHSIERRGLEWVSDTRYAGLLNRASSNPKDPLSRYCRMLCAKVNGKVRYFPSTINSRATSDRVVADIKVALASAPGDSP